MYVGEKEGRGGWTGGGVKLAGVPSHRGKLDFLKTKVRGWAV